MIKTQVTAVAVIFSLVLATVTSGRFYQDTDDRLEKRTMSDQRLAELQALIALSRGNAIQIGHGQLDPMLIGKRRKRSVDNVFRGLNDNQKLGLLDILMQREAEQLS